MVQRGSKIRPDATLADAQLAVRRAHDYLEQKKQELARVRTDSRDLLQRRESGVVASVDDEELEVIIRLLIAKIDAVEEAQLSARNASDAVLKTVQQLACGGVAGALARTCVAPIDRVKILKQTQHVAHGYEKYGGSIVSIVRQVATEEGAKGLWRGNGVNCLRVFPYAGLQFVSYDLVKGALSKNFEDRPDEFVVARRLCAGTIASATATSFTHPIDVIRLRLTVDPKLRGALDAARSVMQEGTMGFFKGYRATLISIAPFTAINFAAFDSLKDTAETLYPGATKSTVAVLGLGGTAGLTAQIFCFPLDTVRRRMQLKGNHYAGVINAFQSILSNEGVQGLYRGMAANAMKVVPNSAVRFTVFDRLKAYLGL